jgi:hypothetical protein
MFTNMDEAEINIGDKIFVYGQFSVENAVFSGEYNAVLGYMTVGGYDVWAEETNAPNACIPGLVIEVGDFLSADLKFETDRKMIDITDKLALQVPMTMGSRVWMPTKP